jgi:hypothetical protein
MSVQAVTRVVALITLVGVTAGGATAAEAARASGACGETSALTVPQPTSAQMAAAGLARLPVAPLSRRVDLVAPPFSDPTSVTNPLRASSAP